MVVCGRRPSQSSYLFFQHFSASLTPGNALTAVVAKDNKDQLDSSQYAIEGNTVKSSHTFGSALATLILIQDKQASKPPKITNHKLSAEL